MTVAVGAVDRVDARLDDPRRTSAEQREAARAEGNFLLRGCPGAGKTYTVGLRLARLAAEDPRRALVALSHTNVAVRAIRETAAELAELPPQTFVGTLHSFLLSSVVYRHGRRYMGCGGRPRVVAREDEWPPGLLERLGGRRREATRPWRFEPRVDGSLEHVRAAEWGARRDGGPLPAELAEWIWEAKRAVWAEGLMSFSDALWIACRVLEEDPELAAEVGGRFDEIVLDEAQDTSGLQLEALARLRAGAEPPSLVLAGDPDQAIYEWRGAIPNRLEAFADAQRLRRLKLTNNYRSSAAICAATVHFSTRRRPDVAAGAARSYGVAPELWTYDGGPDGGLARRFRDRLRELALPEERSAILVRTNAAAAAVNGGGGTDAGRALRELAIEAERRAVGARPTRDALVEIERVLAAVAFGPRKPSRGERSRLRAAALETWSGLPELEGDLAEWNRAAAAHVDAAAGGLVAAPALAAVELLPERAAHVGRDARALLTAPKPGLARTVHDAKGESLAAVLVVARNEDLDGWFEEMWLQWPRRSLAEETRIAYVAMTRAERLLALALPESVEPELLRRIEATGFRGARRRSWLRRRLTGSRSFSNNLASSHS